MHNTTLQCTMEKEGGGGGVQTERGKINTNVVSYWVLMSTQEEIQNEWAEQKNEEKDVKY